MGGSVGGLGAVAGAFGATVLGGPIAGQAAATAGAVGLGGSGSSGDSSILNLIQNMNAILGNAQTGAVNASTAYTTLAQQEQQTGLNAATNALNTGNTNADNALNTLSTSGAQSSNALTQPFATAGYNALDMYEDSLGVARPAAGNAALASSLYNNAQAATTLNPLFATLQTDASKVNGATAGLNSNNLLSLGSEAAAPKATALGPTGGAATAQQVNILAQQMAGVPANQINPNASLAQSNPQIYARAAQQLNQQMQNTINGQAAKNASITAANNTAQTNYNNYNTAYQAYNTALQNPNFTPQGLALGQAYNSGNVAAPVQVNVGAGGIVPGAR